jgi:hypothetical protein
MRIHGRSEWARHPWVDTPYTVPRRIRTEYMIHYEGGNPTSDTGADAMRSIEDIHLGNGWWGIGYNFVIMPDGTVWEGRGLDYVGAHCKKHNRIGWGVQIHLGGTQKPTDAALHSAVDLYEYLCKAAGHTLRKLGHMDGYATLCPGALLEAWVRAGMARPNGATPSPGTPQPVVTPGVPAPVFPLPAGWYFGPKSGPASSVSGYYSHRADLARWQKRMSDRGWDLAADGLYGPVTARVARHFQTEKRLTADGLIGINTWRAAWMTPVT